MLRYGFIPEAQLDGRLSVVMADPSDVVKIDELELLLGQPVEVKVGVRSAIEEILQKPCTTQELWAAIRRTLGREPSPGPAVLAGEEADRLAS